MQKTVLLSFDVEEFDLPREHNIEISLEKGVKVSKSGLLKVLKILERQDVVATFFCTGNFVEAEPELIKKIAKAGHEIACHGVDHFNLKPSDIEISKKIIQKVTRRKVLGYRVPRMQPINYRKMKKLGYLYDSSVNPAFIPGRYNHLDIPRKKYLKNGIIEIPTSVATVFRVPLFWLALHIFPEKLYFMLAKMTLKKTGYFATYFHPWEFTDLYKFPCVPKYIQYNSGKRLEKRLENLIIELKKSGCEFKTYAAYAKIS
ncbi:polysaccharide deacetylase family protein [Candidatus Saccharibacteria bacterium]|nr:polysaccharide deacetylase family protein [Candidatus Saccharibacteria bacterium]